MKSLWPLRMLALACGLLAGAPAQAGDLLIGQVVSLSGPLADMGRELQDGAQVCVDWINRQGGVAGRRLRLIAGDDGGQPARALQEAQALANSPRAPERDPREQGDDKDRRRGRRSIETCVQCGEAGGPQVGGRGE